MDVYCVSWLFLEEVLGEVWQYKFVIYTFFFLGYKIMLFVNKELMLNGCYGVRFIYSIRSFRYVGFFGNKQVEKYVRVLYFLFRVEFIWFIIFGFVYLILVEKLEKVVLLKYIVFSLFVVERIQRLY